MVPPRRRRRERPTFHCPNCSAEVPLGAAACRECGSDDATGWSDATLYDDLDLPEVDGPPTIPDTFEEFERLTARSPSRRRHQAIGLVLLVLTLVLLLA